MLNVLICEDNPGHRWHLEAIIRNYILNENSDVKIVLSTDNPTDVINFLSEYPHESALYFLDIDLQHSINGIELATKVRENDSYAKIVFITSYRDQAHLALSSKVEAMDFIVKDMHCGLEEKIVDCIQFAYKRYGDDKPSKNGCFNVKSGGEIWNIPFSDIFFFRTHPKVRHKVMLHMKNHQIEFRSLINEVENIGNDFHRCHQSCVVNIKNILRVDKVNRTVEMINGEVIPVSVRKVGALQARLLRRQKIVM